MAGHYFGERMTWMRRHPQPIGVAIVGFLTFAIQFSGIALVSNDASQPALVGTPRTTPSETMPIVVMEASGAGDQNYHGVVAVVWREFRPSERLTENPSGYICGAAFQRGTGEAALIVRLCSGLPTTPVRRYGLGYNDFVVEATLPGDQSLSYDLIEVRAHSWKATTFSEGPTSDNTVPIRRVFVRDTTDIVIQFARDLPPGLPPSVRVSGKYRTGFFKDEQVFAPLGFGPDETRLELMNSAYAPAWALLRP